MNADREWATEHMRECRKLDTDGCLSEAFLAGAAWQRQQLTETPEAAKGKYLNELGRETCGGQPIPEQRVYGAEEGWEAGMKWARRTGRLR